MTYESYVTNYKSYVAEGKTPQHPPIMKFVKFMGTKNFEYVGESFHREIWEQDNKTLLRNLENRILHLSYC